MNALNKRERYLMVGLVVLALAAAITRPWQVAVQADEGPLLVRPVAPAAVKARPEPVQARAIRQDPFHSRLRETAAPTAEPVARPKGPRELPVGQGIFQDASRRFALIDGKVIAEGERVAGCLVREIGAERVVLQGEDGVLVLTIKERGSR